MSESSFPLLSFGTLADTDDISWEFRQPCRILAIGDLHGDIKAFGALCRAVGIVDAEGHWSGGNAHLVLMGDLVGGNKDSRFLLDMVMRLESEAKMDGGQVHALFGNHDLMPLQGCFQGMTVKELRYYREIGLPETLFRGHTEYAKWLRTRNALIRVGGWLFTHAALDRWAFDIEPSTVNSTVRAWVRYWQGVGSRPPENTFWVVASEEYTKRNRLPTGPIWNRSFRVKLQNDMQFHRPKCPPLTPVQLVNVLERWQVKRLVVGHSPVDGGKILMRHPSYDERVIMIDTRISGPGGTLSALLITSDNDAKAVYPGDREPGRTIKAIQKRRSREKHYCRVAA